MEEEWFWKEPDSVVVLPKNPSTIIKNSARNQKAQESGKKQAAKNPLKK